MPARHAPCLGYVHAVNVTLLELESDRASPHSSNPPGDANGCLAIREERCIVKGACGAPCTTRCRHRNCPFIVGVVVNTVLVGDSLCGRHDAELSCDEMARAGCGADIVSTPRTSHREPSTVVAINGRPYRCGLAGTTDQPLWSAGVANQCN